MAGLARIPRALAFSAAQKREIRFQRGGRAAGYSAVCLSEMPPCREVWGSGGRFAGEARRGVPMKRSPSQHPHPRLTRGIAACTERTVGEPGVNEIVHLEERVPASSEPGLSIKEVADWQRIRIGKPQVLGVNEQYSGLLDVDVPLEPSPDVHWD